MITGTPRSRTAWMAAVITAHGVHCHHDGLVYAADPADPDVGFSDPAIGCLHPELAEHCQGPIIVIRRDSWVPAFQDAFQVVLNGRFIDRCERNLDRMEKRARLVLPWEALQTDTVVAEVIELCTSKPASDQTIQLFQQMNIQQNIARAQAFSAAPLRSM